MLCACEESLSVEMDSSLDFVCCLCVAVGYGDNRVDAKKVKKKKRTKCKCIRTVLLSESIGSPSALKIVGAHHIVINLTWTSPTRVPRFQINE